MATSTGLLAHLQTSVPPAKLAEPGLRPLSTAGWIEIFAMSVLPKLLVKVAFGDGTYAPQDGSRSREAVRSEGFSSNDFGTVSLLRAGRISVRVLGVELFTRYLKFFRTRGT